MNKFWYFPVFKILKSLKNQKSWDFKLYKLFLKCSMFSYQYNITPLKVLFKKKHSIWYVLPSIFLVTFCTKITKFLVLDILKVFRRSLKWPKVSQNFFKSSKFIYIRVQRVEMYKTSLLSNILYFMVANPDYFSNPVSNQISDFISGLNLDLKSEIQIWSGS